jgi:ubiquinone/menaquinone biosynthesis C-methylase UbiE
LRSPEYAGESALYYDHVATGVEGDVAFYVEEARRAGSPVLELGCGTGRILIPTAEAGVEIVGLDASSDMLRITRGKLEVLAPDVSQRVKLVEGDMRRFALDRDFSLVTIPYRAFLHNLDVEDQIETLRRVREHLSDGGRLIFNVFDPKVQNLAAGKWSMPANRRREFLHPQTGNRVTIKEEFTYDLEKQMVEGAFVFDEIDTARGEVVGTFRSPLTLRYIFRYEMEHLLALSDFRIEALFGDFRRGPFVAGGEQVWIARPR